MPNPVFVAVIVVLVILWLKLVILNDAMRRASEPAVPSKPSVPREVSEYFQHMEGFLRECSSIVEFLRTHFSLLAADKVRIFRADLEVARQSERFEGESTKLESALKYMDLLGHASASETRSDGSTRVTLAITVVDLDLSYQRAVDRLELYRKQIDDWLRGLS
ncbi:MAG: hypothetical protein K2W95_24860 [Candidatus Obscuribacterales bacterium]|nr:hypothetical protein [Candidatus Obscuribacterales bacterium]